MAIFSLLLSGTAIVSFLTTGTGASVPQAVPGVYSLDATYSGEGFFDGFDFFTDSDPKNGFVTYVDRETALNKNYVSVKDDGTVHIGVDSTTSIDPNGSGRESVRIETKKTWTRGLFINDVSNMPGGACSIWPSWMSHGPNLPAGGTINIIEGVNTQEVNLMSCQTSPKCTINGFYQSGPLMHDNCDVVASFGTGCATYSNRSISFGYDFNSNKGGVFATEWTSEYIWVWFFPRGQVPDDITNGTPRPRNWGRPAADFMGNCNIDSHFFENKFILGADFCGDWAGAVWPQDSVCSALAPTCEAYVAGNPNAFSDMYWAINSIKVYKLNATETTSSSTSLSSSSSTTASFSPSSSATSTSSSSLTTTSFSSSSSSVSANFSSVSVSASITSASSSLLLNSSHSSPTSSSSAALSTISTVYTTSIYTITSCAPTVTNCPAHIGKVTTEVISLYTTWCPVSATKAVATSTSTPAAPSTTEYTTSTVYTTKVYTITSCAATVTDCPARIGKVTTEIASLYTTVCPVTAAPKTTETTSHPTTSHSQSPAGNATGVASGTPTPSHLIASGATAGVQLSGYALFAALGFWLML